MFVKNPLLVLQSERIFHVAHTLLAHDSILKR
jgi:hypothetical protein